MKSSLRLSMSLYFAVVLLAAGAPRVSAAQSVDSSDMVSRRDIRDFQQFLSVHSWIANKLRQQPALANDRKFLNENPELSQFLNAHPFIQKSLRTDASGFMRRAQQSASPGPHGGGGDTGSSRPNRQELMDFQQFLKDHPWIANKLRQDPSLANNQRFLRENHDLPDFLKSHPLVRDQFRSDPQEFMQRTENSANQQGKWGAHAPALAELNEFIMSHPWIAKKLQEDPQLANDRGFLNGNSELKDFLAAHSYLQQQFKEDPQGLMERAREYASQNSM